MNLINDVKFGGMNERALFANSYRHGHFSLDRFRRQAFAFFYFNDGGSGSCRLLSIIASGSFYLKQKLPL